MNRGLSLSPLLLALVASVSGCWFAMDGWDERSPRTTGATTPPPHIDDVYVADWPPLGPSGLMRVTVAGTAQLSRLELGFRNYFSVPLSGSAQTAVVTGSQLGEGYGDLSLRAYDVRGGYAAREVTSLLVDLTPPEIYAQAASVRPATDGANTFVDVWVADAWVLGKVELQFQGVTLVHDFPPGYPDTLGEAWDQSLVRFAAATLPEAVGPATIRATDAAGNTAEQLFDLSVDGTPPVAQILSPAEGTLAEGPLPIEVHGDDAAGSAVLLEVSAGGAPIATIPGPYGTLVLDPAEFSSGPLALSAVAIDDAGNRSEPDRVVVVVP